MAAVVFDFDHSFAEECADFFVLEQLGAPGVAALELIRDRLRSERIGWNACMREAADLLFRDGMSRTTIESAARSIPVFPHHVAIVKLARQLGCACHVVSDANQVWIGECLRAHNVFDSFTTINTNPASFGADGRLHIGPHHPDDAAPHACALSPVNMDKCGVLASLGLSAAVQGSPASGKPRVFYVGDGMGDYCAAISLGSADTVCAREDYPLYKKLRSPASAPRAHVAGWSHGADTLEAFLEWAQAAGGPMAAAVREALAGSGGDGVWPEIHALRAAGRTVGAAAAASASALPLDADVAAAARRVRDEITYAWM